MLQGGGDVAGWVVVLIGMVVVWRMCDNGSEGGKGGGGGAG